MKALDSCTRSRRRRRGANPSIAAYCYAGVILFCCRRDTSGITCLPGATSFYYDEKQLKLSHTHSSAIGIRCGGEESDGMYGQMSSQVASLQVSASTPAAREISSTFVNMGTSLPSKDLRKRIRLIRGGSDEEKSACDVDEVEGKDEKSNSTTILKSESSETRATSKDVGTSRDSKSCSSKIHSDGENEPKQPIQEKGGVFSSFFSLFRSSEESDDPRGTAAINARYIAHKIPHGPDGRGGGSAVLATLPPISTVEDSKERDTDGKEILITTEVTEVSTDATDAGTVEFSKSISKASEAERKPAFRTGGDSTAFVVPPPQNPLPYSVDNSKDENVKKQSKSSRIETMPDEVDGTKTMNALISTRNETVVITASNDTLNSNTTGPLSTSNASVANDTSDDTEMSQQKDYTSSGYWTGIDLVVSLGLSSLSDDLKVSRALRPVRKAAAEATGLHGFISGKEYLTNQQKIAIKNNIRKKTSTIISIDEELGIHDANALEAEMLARRMASRERRRRLVARVRGNNRPGRRWGLRRGQQAPNRKKNTVSDYVVVPALDASPDALEHRRHKRVEDIDRLLQRGSERLLELQCEKDDLLRAPNPLFNHTSKHDPSTKQTFGDVRTTREFNFPSSELVNEYIGELVSNGRLIRLNHTELWQSRSDNGIDEDEDEIIGDDLLTPSADARKLYENLDQLEQGMNRNGNKNKQGGGSWLLRTGFGRNGGSLGEKLGETIEIGAYKGVCSACMKGFAQMLSHLHGVNILSHSDIRLYIEQDPDLPPVDKKYGPLSSRVHNNYAQEAIKTAIQKGAKKKRKTGKHSSSRRSSSRHHGHELSDDAFIQRDAIVETLISYCQISAPLLKLFPLDWQRAMVGNIITLATTIISDFSDGLHVQILGHSLTVSFKPITEADMIQHIGVGGFRQNHRRTRPDEFEAAVMATAQEISESLSFLDGWLEWFERKVGGGVLRSQMGNLIARVVLTLVDEVLSGARLDLWSSQANGPRLFAALEYRTSSKEEPLNE